MKLLCSVVILVVLAAPSFAQPQAVLVDGVWEFNISILGARNVHRFDLKVAGTKLTGRGMFGAAVSGEIQGDAITLSVGAPGREFGELAGRVVREAGGTVMSGDGVLYEGASTWTARRPTERSGKGPVLHEFEPREYHRVITSSVAPALKIFPGDTVRTRTVDAAGYDHHNRRVAPGGNPLVGPFFVHGALVGDTLAVRIKRIRLTRDSAKSGTLVVGNALTSGYLQGRRSGRAFDGNWRLDHPNGVARLTNPTERLKNYTIPLRPMIGSIGVAPFKGQAISTNDSGRHGGNLDYNEVREGTTVYFPVFRPGAMLFLGDGHAAQGDGELSGDALETSLEVEFSVEVFQGKTIRGPRVENEEYLIALGLHGSLTSAMQRATADLSTWLETDFKLDPSEVAAVLGTAMEYQITDLVGMQKGVAARLRKSVLEKLAPQNP
jgi:acetamidase/formamidase